MNADPISGQMQTLVGASHVIPFDHARAAAHRAVIAALAPSGVNPVCVVMPDDETQVQAVVRTAALLDIGVSVMPNAAANGLSLTEQRKASVILDLSRMDEIHDLNTDAGTTLIGPGVSFDQLQAYIAARNAPYWLDSDANGAHSVSGSVAERSFGYTPYGDHLLMQCGMEVVLANGELVRTGMGALPGSDTWQLFKYNFGPYLDGLFSRSDFAIITKLGLWLMPAPPAYHPFMVALPDADALAQAIEIMRPLKIGMVVPNTVAICHASADDALLAAAGLPAATEKRPEWALYGALYGLEENIPIIWKPIEAALRGIDGAAVFTQRKPPSHHPAWPLRIRLMRGEAVFRAVANVRPPQHAFAASAPMEGEAATEMSRIVDEFLHGSSLAASREFNLTWRTLFLRVTIAIAAGAVDETRERALALIERLTTAGYAITHDTPALTDAVRTQHTGAPLRDLYAALGAALDPRGILGRRRD